MTSTTTPTRSEAATHDRLVVARRAARIAVGMLGGLIVFQLALAAGAPLARAAWGGTHATLPTGLRVATLVPVVVYALGALILLRRAGYRVRVISPTIARRGTWTFAIVLVLSALANFASPSVWERLVMGPIALALAALSVVIGRVERPQ
jgi:hypothetical protein